jgi:hypothetical protein
MEADGRTIREARIAVGGVATKPWRLRAVEASLKGKALDEATLRAAAAATAEGAKSSGHNAFKIDLAPKVVARALDDRRRCGMTQHNELELNRRAVMKLGVGTAAVATAGVGLSGARGTAQASWRPPGLWRSAPPCRAPTAR